MANRMAWISWTAYTLLVVGALVHGGQAFGYYAVEELLPMWLARVVYGLVGLAGVYSLIGWWYLVRR